MTSIAFATPECKAALRICTQGKGREVVGPDMTREVVRHLRLLGEFFRLALVREMAFRTHFALQCFVHGVWISLVLLFFELLFGHVSTIGEWKQREFWCFLGTCMLLNSLLNGLVLSNLVRFGELIRSGDLDYLLTLPVDEQVVISCFRPQWSMVPQAAVAGCLVWPSLSIAACLGHWDVVFGYVLLVVAGFALLYSLVLTLASSGLWCVRNESIFELWFALMEAARTPADVYRESWAGWGVQFVLTYLIPVLVAVNVPARFGAMLIVDNWSLIGLLVLSAASLAFSRRFFQGALRQYRSASS